MWICSTSQERELGLNKAGMRDDDSPTLLKFPEYDRSCAKSFSPFGVHRPPIERDGYIGCYHLDFAPVRRKLAHFIGTCIPSIIGRVQLSPSLDLICLNKRKQVPAVPNELQRSV